MTKTLIPGKKFSVTPYMFVFPFLAILLIFTIYPFVEGVRLSILDISGFGEGDFIGLQNFSDVLSDEIFWKSFWHTIQYMVFSLIVQVPISFLLAMVMNAAPGKLRAFLRVAFFIPIIISGVVAAIIFNSLFLREFGAINWILGLFGLPHNYGWLVEPNFAMPVVMTVGFWLYLGYHMVYLLSGLQTIDPVFYESAKIDGATWRQQQMAITLPLMRPALTFSLVTSAIYSMQLFDLPFVLFDQQGASMNYAPSTLMTYVYEYAFKKFLIGQAAAAGWIIFAMVMVITLIQLKLLGFNKTDN
jgi:ABC-type sugar transport system permease subunit